MTTVQPVQATAPAAAAAPAATPAQAEGVDLPVTATALPLSLESTDRALTLKGEVVANNPDGTVRVSTPRGPVDIQLPPGQTAQRGQQVELQIPAGAPPRDMTLNLQPLPAAAPDSAQNALEAAARMAQQNADVALPDSGAVADAIRLSAAALNAQTQRPGQPGAQASPAAGQAAALQESTPQALGVFLKGALETLLKNPAAPPQTAAEKTGGLPGEGVFVQRPLQIGQLARLMPLPTLQEGGWQAGPMADLPGGPLSGARPPALPGLAPALQGGTGAALGMTAASGATLLFAAVPSAGAPNPLVPGAATGALPGGSAGEGQSQTAFVPGAPAGSPGSILQTGLALAGSTTAIGPGLAEGAKGSAFGVTIAAGAAPGPLPQPVDVRVAALVPALAAFAQGGAQNQSLLHGTPLTPAMLATAAGQTAQGLPVLELSPFAPVPEGVKPAPALMVLQYPAQNISAGTALRLDILPQAVPSPPTLAAFAPLQGGFASPAAWQGLDEALHAMRGDPAAASAAQAVQTALPKTGATGFAAPVLMLASALRSGEMAQWLGERGADALRAGRGKSEALARVAEGFSNAATRLAADDAAPRGEWRALSLPLLYGGEVTQVMLHTRAFARDDDAAAGPARRNGTRFVLELALTRMGPLQVDGFSLGRKLDVTLRSEKGLSAPMRETLRARYTDALAGIGFAGQLNFSASAEHKGWVVF